MISFEGKPQWFSAEEDDLREWLVAIASEHGSRIQSLNYVFKDDRQIMEANSNFLGHHYPTDIITFGYKEGKVVAGDVLIGQDTVEANAGGFGSSRHDEMCRVIAHGLLHLIGFDDKTGEDKEIMRAEEEKCLSLRPKKLRDS